MSPFEEQFSSREGPCPQIDYEVFEQDQMSLDNAFWIA